MRLTTVRLVGAAVGLLVLAGGAMGQDKAPLRGPSGDDKSVGGETRRFTGDGARGDKKDRAAQAPVRHPMFLKALDVLRGEGVDESVRLTDAQDEQIKTIDREFRGKVEAFRAEHQEELRDLVSKLSPEDRRKVAALAGMLGGVERGQGVRPRAGRGEGAPARGKDRAPEAKDEMTAGDPAQAEAAREKLRELISTMPRPEDAHKAMFGVLSEAQRPLVQKEVDRIRKEMESKAMEGGRQFDRERERAQRKLDKKDAEGMEGDDQPPTSADDPRIPERARERIKALPEDQQREAIRRLWERMQGAGGGADAPVSIDDPRIPERVRERIKGLPPEQQAEVLKRLGERLRNAQPR